MPDPELVARVQQQLKNIRLFQVDSGDGSMTPKGRTEGAILDFRNREGLPLAPTIDDEFLTRLAKAQPIDVAEHRAYATLEAAAIEHLVGFLALGLAPLILLSVSSFSAILCALLVRLPLAGAFWRIGPEIGAQEAEAPTRGPTVSRGFERPETARNGIDREKPSVFRALQAGLKGIERGIWPEKSSLAPRAGFEPATIRLTVECSTAELPRNRRPKGRERGSV